MQQDKYGKNNTQINNMHEMRKLVQVEEGQNCPSNANPRSKQFLTGINFPGFLTLSLLNI